MNAVRTPAVPKNVLIRIARKKQERSMITAYDAYRKRMTSQVGSKPAIKKSRIQSALSDMDAVQKKIQTLDTATLSQEERDFFCQALEVLAAAVQETLAKLQQPAPVRET